MRVVNCKNWEQVNSHKDAWLELQNSVNIPIFSTYQFLECFWKNFEFFSHPKFGNEKKLCILFFYNDEELSAVLPLVRVKRIRKKIIPIYYLELLGQPFFTSNLDIVVKENKIIHWNFIMDWIQKNIRYHVLNFQLINENSRLYKLIGNDFLKLYSVSPIITTTDYRDFDHYKKQAMSKNFQKILSNSLNRILRTNKAYSFKWESYNSEKHYKWVNEISDSKKEDGKYNVFDQKEMRQFVESIFGIFNAKICTLFLEDIPIAYQVYLYYQDQCMWFDLSFDRSFRDLRPGILIYEEGLKHNFGLINILGYGQDQNKVGIANNLQSVFLFWKSGNIIGSKWLLKLLNHTKI